MQLKYTFTGTLTQLKDEVLVQIAACKRRYSDTRLSIRTRGEARAALQALTELESIFTHLSFPDEEGAPSEPTQGQAQEQEAPNQGEPTHDPH